MIDLSYRETRLSRAAALRLRRFTHARAYFWSANRRAMKPAMAFALLVIIALGLLIYRRANESGKETQRARRQQPPPAIVASPSPTATASPVHDKTRELKAPRGVERTAPDEAPLFVKEDKPDQPKPDEIAPPIVTGSEPNPRNPKPRTQGASLAAVKKVYVDPLGDGTLAQQFRDLLITSLRANPRLIISEDRNEADATLKGKLTTRRGIQVSLNARLVNIKGVVIWPVKGPNAGKQYKGVAGIVADQVVKDLLADIQKAER